MKIAIAGGYGVGMTMRLSRAPRAGETVSGGVLAVGPGGKGSNQAVAVARLGARSSLLTAVGADEQGRAGRALWAAEGVDFEHVVTVAGATMTGFILVDDDGENRIAIAPGALDELDASHVEAYRGEIAGADILLISLEIPLAAAAAAMRIAQESGTPVILNPAPAVAIPDELLALASILTPNLGEAATLLGEPLDPATDPARMARALADLSGAAVVITLGAAGCVVADEEGEYAIPAVDAGLVVDTVGAGDAFSAALAVATADGRPLRWAVRFAVCAGALAVTTAEVVPALPGLDDVAQLMERQDTHA